MWHIKYMSLKSRGSYMCSCTLNIQHFYVLPTQLYLCVVCGSENKQRLFPYAALTDWFYNRHLTLYSPVVTICTASLTLNNSTFCPHSCIYVFCVDLRTNSDYFPIQH